MSDIAGIGSIAQAAVGLTEYIFGSHSSTATDSNTSGSASTTVSETDDTSNSSTTNSNSTTTNSADPAVIASLKQLASTAMSNSTDPTQTQNLLTGILQQAGDAMTSIFGTQNQAGIYNSSAAASQTNDILSRAGADAAQAILGYQTTEQGVADTALNQAASATATQTTNASSTTNSNTSATDTATTNASSQSTTTGSSSTSSGSSVVCTWMFQHKMLGAKKYYVVSQDLMNKTWYVQKGYLMFAAPLVSILERDHTTKLSRAIISIFSARTEHVCALRGLRGCKKSWYGRIARFAIATACVPTSFYFWLQHIGVLKQREVGMV